MSRHRVWVVAITLFAGCTQARIDFEPPPEPYRQIPVNELFSQMIVRNREDRVYSGQIKSGDGLAKFKNNYGIDLNLAPVNFDVQMLIFGITDNISTRAFRFLTQTRSRSFVLDYADTGIMYKLGVPGKGKKHSHLQIFLLDRMEGIPHIEVKNLVADGLSETYK